MIDKSKRKAISTAWRVVSCTGDEQFKALDRLEQLVGMPAAWDVWLSTKPDPVLVKTIMDRRLFDLVRRYSPLRRIIPRPEIAWSNVVGYRPSITDVRERTKEREG